ncbi:MAG: family N-acetyltransferase [Clostridiales bacterium]|jgi:GNAT superfamily N-acetyltransferase|nr:family N-acetyltransferase [Clostridiales bacterium]
MPVNIINRDIAIRNIEKEDLNDVLRCVNQSDESVVAMGRASIFSLEEIHQRYLETLINSMEFFCCIEYKEFAIGILKGRLESKNPNELCLTSLILLEEYRGLGLGTKILQSVEEYFSSKFFVNKFYALIMENNNRAQQFWINNNYKIARVTLGVEEIGSPGMIILDKYRSN